MKKNFLKLASFTAMIAVAALSFTACSDDDDNNGSETKFEADVYLNGDITSDTTLDESLVYCIDGPVIVTNGATLTVPAGMTIYAEPKFSAYILVAQGGKMNVEGTASAPVTFTPTTATGNWGGLVINGYAPISGSNDPAVTANVGATEVSTSFPYGGTDAADDSGSYTYMILDRTGASSSADVEHNGLTLNGVGSGTTIENIYIPSTADDGVEFFGGSVNVTNLLVVNSDDDMFDFTQGYTGTLTNCYGVWEAGYSSLEGDPRGVEADGNLDGKDSSHLAQSNFTIANMTIVNNSTFQMHDAIKVRRGATATITNALVKGSGETKDLIDFVDSKGDGTVASSVSVTSTLAYTNEIVTTTANLNSEHEQFKVL